LVVLKYLEVLSVKHSLGFDLCFEKLVLAVQLLQLALHLGVFKLILHSSGGF
jgi:hypothetical protein